MQNTDTCLKLAIESGEYWWSGCTADGVKMPVGADGEYHRDFSHHKSSNQANPVLLSSHGRYIYCEKGFIVDIHDGEISVTNAKSPIINGTAGTTLREAYLKLCGEYWHPQDCPPPEFFRKPQYNTWIELLYNQNEKDILRYAQDITENGLPAGVLMIDDGWFEDYGDWRFNARKFEKPAEMTARLHKMGFKVMLWIAPFVSPDGESFRYLEKEKLLVKNPDGSTAIRQWWNGYSGVLDLSNPRAWEWFKEQTDRLVGEYGVDGFKFDAGDSHFYTDDDITFGGVDANTQSLLYAQFAMQYPFNELRACYGLAGCALVQRQYDKHHKWNQQGLGALVPCGLEQSIAGYAFHCPDMIGGGEIASQFKDCADEELVVRYAQCAALFPMMQFSTAIWNILKPENWQLCMDAVEIHNRFSEQIYELAVNAGKTGEPIMRNMEYVFPRQGMECCTGQFMIGDSILVAPVLEKGDVTKKIHFPRGEWISPDGDVVTGPGVTEVKAPLSRLPVYIKKD